MASSRSRVLARSRVLSKKRADRYGARSTTVIRDTNSLSQYHTVETNLGTLHFPGTDAAETSRMVETERRDVCKFFTHDLEVRQWIHDYLKENQIFWDVGANFGMFALYAALKPGVRVHAFEPYVPALMEMMQSVRLNQFEDRVHVYPMAVGVKTEIAQVHLDPITVTIGQGWRGIDNKQINADKKPYGFYHVPCSTLDDLCDVFGVPQPQHIKIDIDGLDIDVVVAGLHKILANVHTLMVEVEQKDEERLHNELIPFLSSAGLHKKNLGDALTNCLFVR